MSQSNKQKSKVLVPPVERQESMSSSTSESYETNIFSKESSKSTEGTREYSSSENTKGIGNASSHGGRGEPQKLEAHLALECAYVDDEVRQIYLLRVSNHDQSDEAESDIQIVLKKQKINKQSSISKFFPQSGGGLSEARINAINSSLLKAFVVCGIPFSVVENPFFIDLLQNLCPNYQLPSKEVLAEHTFGLRLIKDCNEIIKYFKKSHQPNAYLQQAINELKISGGGLKKFIDTRWTSAYECTLSVNRLERAFVKIMNEHPELITNLINRRWRNFDSDIYILAYFLHPGYRARLREQHFQVVAETAIKLWQEEGKDQYECADLVAYMRRFLEKDEGFKLPYSFENDTPLLWWSTNFVGSKSIGKLATKVFSITPHSADCERTFSALDDDDEIAEDSEIEEEESEYNFNVIERFDLDNIVFLNDEIFQDNESDENSQIDDEFDEIEHDELTSSDVERRGVYEFDSSKLAADLVRGWGHEDYESVNVSINSIANEVSKNISENVNNIEGEDSVLETLPIALRKTCRQSKK
ncbi:10197_t:CDS:2 [Scutellospora calospora]|uniref:10197_t:CDS:1 n=1 Tax=Scutellospora calospora TaxID=85575 RepID=A0ACA9KBH8_9GLOM|nr:10197_t:CDS:2 [Scutellospora calospora]